MEPEEKYSTVLLEIMYLILMAHCKNNCDWKLIGTDSSNISGLSGT